METFLEIGLLTRAIGWSRGRTRVGTPKWYSYDALGSLQGMAQTA